MITLNVQDITVQLREYHDLSFVDGYGRVLRVFDQLNSGLLCFQMELDKKLFFLKYAGAPTLKTMQTVELSIQRLRLAATRYETLRHPALAAFRGARDYGSGFACLFDWVDGLPLAPLKENAQRLRAAPLMDRLKMMDALADLHVTVESHGLVACGLQDTQLIYQPQRAKLMLTHIDGYLQMPALNLRGRQPGSPFYLAPEAYRMGDALDETTTVYAMGAIALRLFGDWIGQKKAGWEASSNLYEVAARALLKDRDMRFQSTLSFQEAWRQAVKLSPLS
jgi:serine/threonine-protein kinase